MDGATLICDEYRDHTRFPSMTAGSKKSPLTPVDLNTKIGDVVVLGNFIEYYVKKLDDSSVVDGPRVSVSEFLMRNAEYVLKST